MSELKIRDIIEIDIYLAKLVNQYLDETSKKCSIHLDDVKKFKQQLLKVATELSRFVSSKELKQELLTTTHENAIEKIKIISKSVKYIFAELVNKHNDIKSDTVSDVYFKK